MTTDIQIKKELKRTYPELYDELNVGRPSTDELVFRLKLNEEDTYKDIVESLGGFSDY